LAIVHSLFCSGSGDGAVIYAPYAGKMATYAAYVKV